ncbi:superoxide dismutase family protein [Actinoplanes solisilvae]|uniref:superoxide dismutase family protein n=1 Tax=Actinoplanes solisilvae TaxID=2486853 RepID=UPI000FDCC490|nr:superoxide dismutase family protein [Actinoplanes solisilvae]
MLLRALVLALPTALLAGCANPAEIVPTTGSSVLTSVSPWSLYQGSTSPSPIGSASPEIVAAGTFLPFKAGSTAISYDPKVVPPGAKATVSIAKHPAGIEVRLETAGLIPRRTYGAHLHTKPCAALPADAGPHYQHRKDPAAAASPPSVDPSYANPRNEIWLDFTVDGYGTATTSAVLNWTFPPGASARSLILHAERTKTAPGVAGSAGDRVACLTLPER